MFFQSFFAASVTMLEEEVGKWLKIRNQVIGLLRKFSINQFIYGNKNDFEKTF